MDAAYLESLFDEMLTDKGKYAAFYARWFPLIDPKVVLEIGYGSGGGMRALEVVYPNADIFGIDIVESHKSERVFHGDSGDDSSMNSILARIGRDPDLVIDDGGHRWEDQIRGFVTIWPRLAPGGFYIIEDLETSYLRGYGTEEGQTCVRYLKSLVDVMNDHHSSMVLQSNYYSCTIASMNFAKNIVLIEKKTAPFDFTKRDDPPPLEIGGAM